MLHMMRTDLAATLNEREHGFLANSAPAEVLALAGVLVLLQATDIGFISLYGLTLTAHRREIAARCHCLADSVSHKPRGLIGDAQHAVQLVGAHAFLAGRKQMNR